MSEIKVGPFLGVDIRYDEPDSIIYVIKIVDRKSFEPSYLEMDVNANVIRTMSGKIAISRILYGGTTTTPVREITENMMTR